MSHQKIIRQLISRFCGIEKSNEYEKFKLNKTQPIVDSANLIMQAHPIAIGSCAMLSSSWAAFLNDEYSIPAIAVAGDLSINNKRIFKCKKNLPIPKQSQSDPKMIRKTWNGHCWIEIDGYIGDLSIFRTAYKLNDSSILKQFITSHFGEGRGAIFSPLDQLPEGMVYTPKYVLTDPQMNSLIRGLDQQSKEILKAF